MLLSFAKANVWSSCFLSIGAMFMFLRRQRARFERIWLIISALSIFAYAIGNLWPVFAYAIGMIFLFFAYAIGKTSIFWWILE